MGIGAALLLFRNWKVAGGLVLVAVLAANFLYIKHLRGEIVDLTADRMMFKRWYIDASNANAENMATIRVLEGANNSLAAAIRVSEEERIAAVKAATERAVTAEAELDDTLESLEELRNETPSCAELSRIDMGAACPAVTERLREHATGTSSQD